MTESSSATVRSEEHRAHASYVVLAYFQSVRGLDCPRQQPLSLLPSPHYPFLTCPQLVCMVGALTLLPILAHEYPCEIANIACGFKILVSGPAARAAVSSCIRWRLLIYYSCRPAWRPRSSAVSICMMDIPYIETSESPNLRGAVYAQALRG